MRDHQQRLADVRKDLNTITTEVGANSAWLWALGRVVANYQNIQVPLVMMLWRLVDPEDPGVGQIAVAESSDRQRVEVFGALVHRRLERESPPGPWKSELATLRNELARAEDTRNQIVHGFYVFDVDAGDGTPPSTRLKVTARPKTGLTHRVEAATSQVLAETSAEIARAHEMLTEFIARWLPDLWTGDTWSQIPTGDI